MEILTVKPVFAPNIKITSGNEWLKSAALTLLPFFHPQPLD
jgi:hypothetical protein